MKCLAAFLLLVALHSVSHAITVIDPSNLAQNVLSARRALEQIQNQVRQLQNEATMLLNDTRNLQRLDFNTLNRLRSTLATTTRLFDHAEGLAFRLSDLETQFARAYPETYAATATHDEMLDDALGRWTNSREALHTTMRLQAQATENFSADESVVSDLIARSQSAEGALQAAQATNQLLALHTRQLIQSQQLAIAQDRATALEHARALASESRSRELRHRFMTKTTKYTR